MQFNIDTRFDAGQPGNPTGHLELTFDDNAGLAAGHIKLTVQAVGFDSTENVDSLFLNFGPNPPATTLDPSKLTISQLSGIANTGIKHGVGNKPTYNQYKADGTGGFFDMEITFGQGTKGIMKGDKAVFDFGPGTLGSISLNDFDFTSFSDQGDGKKGSKNFPFYTAAHFQSIGALKGQSTWAASGPGTTPTPEPATITLMLLCGGCLAGRAGWRRYKAQAWI
jgi:hypothetical protein